MGVGDADANPLLDGDSDDTEDAVWRLPGGGVAVAERLPGLPMAVAALIREGDVRTEVEKAGLRRPFRNWRYWEGW